MKLYIRNGKWQVEFIHEGQRKRLAVGLPGTASQEDAEKAASMRMRRTYSLSAASDGSTNGNVPGTAQGGYKSLSEALERTWNVRWSKGRAVGTRRRIDALQDQVGWWLIKDITYKRLLDLQQGWAKERKPGTVNRCMCFLRTALKQVRREDASLPSIEFPSALPEDNIRERYLSADEEVRVLAWLAHKIEIEALERSYGGPLVTPDWEQTRDAFVILVDTGMRRGELIKLGPTNLIGRHLHLKHGTTKSSKARAVPLTARALQAVERWMAYPPRTGDWLANKWDQVREACDVEDVNMHILRHTCASRLVQSGVGLYEVMKWLGHANMKVTERYAHLAPDALEGALGKLTGVGRVDSAEVSRLRAENESLRQAIERLTTTLARLGSLDGARQGQGTVEGPQGA